MDNSVVKWTKRRRFCESQHTIARDESQVVDIRSASIPNLSNTPSPCATKSNFRFSPEISLKILSL